MKENNVIVAAKGGGIAFGGILFNHIIGLAFILVIVRIVGAEDFGLYKLSFTITHFVAILSLLGLTRGIIRYIPIARNKKNDQKIWGIIQAGIGIPLFLSLCLFLIVIIYSSQISTIIFNKIDLAPVLRLASVSIPLFVVSATFAAICQGFKKLQYEVYAENIAKNIFKFILSLILVSFGFGAMGITAAHIASAVLSLIIFFYFINSLFSFNRPIKSAKYETKEILTFSFPLYLSQILNQFGRRFETLVLGIFGVVKDVAVYSAILNISLIGKMGFAALRKISLPIISELHNQKKIKELEIYYQTVTKWALSFNLPIFCTILLFSEDILLIFGKEFSVGKTGLIILAAGALIDASTGICGAVINMTGYSKVTFFNSIIFLIITLVLGFILIPKWHLIGAAISGALSVAIINLIRLVEVYYLVEGLLPVNRSFFKPLVAMFLSTIITYWFRKIVFINYPIFQFFFLAALLWSLYIVILIKLKLSEEDLLIITKLWKWIKAKK